ncbi:hypothetical protein HK105_207337 [Polyrhizophydium stewartii]|uniref:Uncharacterized protein n=1 Tax=Polyrhizophydium stewartii TaxID=2732419 RepID=A0ABR4N180_9FUNG
MAAQLKPSPAAASTVPAGAGAAGETPASPREAVTDSLSTLEATARQLEAIIDQRKALLENEARLINTAEVHLRLIQQQMQQLESVQASQLMREWASSLSPQRPPRSLSSRRASPAQRRVRLHSRANSTKQHPQQQQQQCPAAREIPPQQPFASASAQTNTAAAPPAAVSRPQPPPPAIVAPQHPVPPAPVSTPTSTAVRPHLHAPFPASGTESGSELDDDADVNDDVDGDLSRRLSDGSSDTSLGYHYFRLPLQTRDARQSRRAHRDGLSPRAVRATRTQVRGDAVPVKEDYTSDRPLKDPEQQQQQQQQQQRQQQQIRRKLDFLRSFGVQQPAANNDADLAKPIGKRSKAHKRQDSHDPHHHKQHDCQPLPPHRSYEPASIFVVPRDTRISSDAPPDSDADAAANAAKPSKPSITRRRTYSLPNPTLRTVNINTDTLDSAKLTVTFVEGDAATSVHEYEAQVYLEDDNTSVPSSTRNYSRRSSIMNFIREKMSRRPSHRAD